MLIICIVSYKMSVHSTLHTFFFFFHLAFKNIFCADLVSLLEVQPSSCPEC